MPLLEASAQALKSAYISRRVNNEPVLVFRTESDAALFQRVYPNGRIYEWDRTKVYLPRPVGLVENYIAKGGDHAFVFTTSEAAREWNYSLYGIGRVYAGKARNVYLGEQK